jgi:ligand-binding sensor domain-containing protein/signal transduction histidine kinase
MRFFVCFILSFWVFTTQAQHYSFSTFSLEQGLPQSQVSAIVEDHYGYLWVGTLGGLARFNGKNFQNFTQENGLLSNRVTSLNSIDSSVWIGHDNGISSFQNKTFSNWNFGKENKNNPISSVLSFQQKIIGGSNGSGLYVLEKNNQFRNIKLNSADKNRVRGLLAKDGVLYIATRGGLLTSTNLRDFNSITFQGETINVSSILEHEHEIILATYNLGILHLNPKTGIVTKRIQLDDDIGIRNLVIDNSKNIWCTSFDGIYRISISGNIQLIDETKGLPLNALSSIYKDKNGYLWIGSEGKGLFKFNGDQFVSYTAKQGLNSELIVSTLHINENLVLLGSYDKGLLLFNKKTRIFETIADKDETIWALYKDKKGSIWIGSENGLFTFDINKKTLKVIQTEYPDLKITSFFSDDAYLWAGSNLGLVRIQLENHQVKMIAPRERDELGTIRHVARFQNKLICASDNGLFTYDGSFKRYLDINKKVYCITFDKNEKLWIGTDNGLYFTDGKSMKPIYLSSLPSSRFINFIQCRENKTFVGTNNGIYVLEFNPKTKKFTNTHFGVNEGLLNLETNINSAGFDKNNTLWFGTTEGLVQFDYNKNKELSSSNPFLTLKSLKVNFEDLDYSTVQHQLNAQNELISLILPFNKNNLLLELEGVSTQEGNTIRYQYFVDGLDEKWSPFFSNNEISLSNLPAGQYAIRIRAVGSNDLFSNEYILSLTITPPFYKTWWFIGIIIMITLFIIRSLFKMRIRKEKEKNEKEKLEFTSRLLALEQQSLNASMNRHFIFNSLNSIQYFINTQDRVSANRYLTNFAKLIRKNLDSSNQHGGMVPLSEEIERLELYLSLESMRFKDRFEFKIHTNGVDLESVLVPAMLLQPFVENSIIHGILPIEDRKGEINIDLKQLNDVLEITIEDNGIGIENSLKKKQAQYGDHKSQGMEITSKRIELLKKLKGQDFVLEGPFQRDKINRSLNGTYVLLKIPIKNLENQF